jgi:uncharacterized BrkB/YihY/UPF0761 family membrane protein
MTVYKVLRALIALCLISIGSGILVTIISMIVGWEGSLFFGVAEVTYGLYGIVLCGIAQALISLYARVPQSMKPKLSPKARGKR